MIMNDFRHGKCVKVGHCAKNCQRFMNDDDSTTCNSCGHNISEHVIVAVKGIIEGLIILLKDNDISHTAVELSERKQQFTKPKISTAEVSKPKVSGA